MKPSLSHFLVLMVAVRPLLISFLVLLQVLMPLLHAHSGANSIGTGIHVPGLEGFGSTVKSPVKLVIVKQLCNITTECSDDNGVMVAVDTGFRVNEDNVLPKLYELLPDFCNFFFLPTTDRYF